MSNLKRAALVLALYCAYALIEASEANAPTGCTTDTECSAYCPPDPSDCDGGPQS